MDQEQSLISFMKYLRDIKEENNHLPQGLIPKALSLFTEMKDQSRRTAILLFRTIIITNNQSGENVDV